MPKKEGTDPKREDLHLTFFLLIYYQNQRLLA
jgi:hypothetical protein